MNFNLEKSYFKVIQKNDAERSLFLKFSPDVSEIYYGNGNYTDDVDSIAEGEKSGLTLALTLPEPEYLKYSKRPGFVLSFVTQPTTDRVIVYTAANSSLMIFEEDTAENISNYEISVKNLSEFANNTLASTGLGVLAKPKDGESVFGGIKMSRMSFRDLYNDGKKKKKKKKNSSITGPFMGWWHNHASDGGAGGDAGGDFGAGDGGGGE